MDGSTKEIYMLVARVCVVCGSQFSVKAAEVNRGRGKCCSKPCAARTASRPDQSGFANPNWKGGFTDTARVNRHKQRYPEKHNARREMTNAIRRGDLVRGPCEVCASEKVEGHHDDYTKPLAVRWLCKTHHLEHHRSAYQAQPIHHIALCVSNRTGDKTMNTISSLNTAHANRGYRPYASRPTDGRETFHYCLADVPLICEIYWEREEKQTWTEPGWPAQATLESADCGGLNIYEILSDEQREEIQTAFLEQS